MARDCPIAWIEVSRRSPRCPGAWVSLHVNSPPSGDVSLCRGAAGAEWPPSRGHPCPIADEVRQDLGAVEHRRDRHPLVDAMDALGTRVRSRRPGSRCARSGARRWLRWSGAAAGDLAVHARVGGAQSAHERLVDGDGRALARRSRRSAPAAGARPGTDRAERRGRRPPRPAAAAGRDRCPGTWPGGRTAWRWRRPSRSSPRR